MRNAIRTTSGRRRGQRFDAQHGVVTEALIFLGELDPETIGPALEDATHYEPTPMSDFDALLDAVPVAEHHLRFVDVGSGMGRAVLLASRRPFAQVVGVEVSRALHEVACENLRRWQNAHLDLACRDVRLVNADASRLRFPRGNLLFYLYNPFGRATMMRFVTRVSQEVTGDCFLVYHTPVHRDVIEERGDFERIADLRFAAVYRKRNER